MINEDITIPPSYCQYADGPCDQSFDGWSRGGAFFVYPSQPRQIAATIEGAIQEQQRRQPKAGWVSWSDLRVGGKIIFTEICKTMRFSSSVVADVTTLNFNVLFEIGYSIGLGLPVLPIRDTSYIQDKRLFDELGILDTLGYVDFENKEDLLSKLSDQLPTTPFRSTDRRIYRESPLYILKSPRNTEGSIQLMATINKSPLRYRVYDPAEDPRLSLNEAAKQAAQSVGVVAHLLSPKREGSAVHNALCALVSGMAMAQQKVVIMLQEERVPQPIDYRDVVVSYEDPDKIPRLLSRPIRQIVENLQFDGVAASPSQPNLLSKLDLGDVAAENEIRSLGYYFVSTGQFAQAKRGHARLVVGRKGTGKTAIFYQVRESLGRGRSQLILDLKPEGHQFSKLRHVVLDKLPAGLQEHTMVAFWNYILLAELAREIVDEWQHARRDPRRFERYEKVAKVYESHNPGYDADFSQRLLRSVERIAKDLGGVPVEEVDARLTELIYKGDVRDLNQAVPEYLVEKDVVWLLLDNLDKSWPIRGTTSEDILIVRSLLDATRKLQRQLESRGVEFKCLVFLRTDIHEHLMRDIPDKGKDTAIRLDWEDRAVFEEIVKRRIETSTDMRGELRVLWPQLFDSLIGSEDSFNYIVDRTLMRPRDLLKFVNRAVEVAINRGHKRVSAEDIVHAEKSYSEDMLLTTSYEIQDTHPDYGDAIYEFQGADQVLTKETVDQILFSGGVEKDRLDEAIELLLWFSFLGVTAPSFAEDKYSYSVQSNIRRLLHPINQGRGAFVVHPAFRAALAG